MAASITIEEERGTYVRSPHHPHNGYYAGDFSRLDLGAPFRAATRPGSGRTAGGTLR